MHLLQFGTTFTEMDALRGRNQTTKGIWFAKSNKVTEPVTMVMDLEGSDGRERGEDDTSFERQSSLFALAVADILLVNMWAKDIGRESGSGKPLLKTIFQVDFKHRCSTYNTTFVAQTLATNGTCCRLTSSSSPRNQTKGRRCCCLSSGT